MWRLLSTASENFSVSETQLSFSFCSKNHLLYAVTFTLMFHTITVCDVLPLVINNMDMRLPASLMQKYMLKAAEFYIGYVTRGPSPDVQIQGKAPL